MYAKYTATPNVTPQQKQELLLQLKPGCMT